MARQEETERRKVEDRRRRERESAAGLRYLLCAALSEALLLESGG
jgi:hypothetical protein